MRKLFKSWLVLSAAVLFMTGCAKDQLVSQEGGDVQTVTFSAKLADEVETKAVADNDGAAASVNRCVMEIYYADKLYTREYAKVAEKEGKMTAEFKGITLVVNRTYKVAFWADYIPNTDFISTDNFYDTSSLKAVSLKGDYIGNNDARDAFSCVQDYTIKQTSLSFTATLTRPFSQINVITTDLQSFKGFPELNPAGVGVTIKNAFTAFDVVSQTASQPQDLTYSAGLYNFPEDSQIGDKTDATLSMDYVFASTEKGTLDIEWEATKTSDDPVNHSFSNIPFQRNYRTNIKGNLLTAQADWTVTVDPTWSGDGSSETDPHLVNYVAVQNIADANALLAAGTKYVNILQPTDAATVNVTVPADGKDYGVAISGTTSEPIKVTQTGDTPTNGTLGLSAPDGVSFNIDCPNLTVTLNGTAYQDVTAGTASSTLIVEKSVTISGKLTLTQGNAVIYGKVDNVVLDPAEGKTAGIKEWHVYSAAQFASAVSLGAEKIVLEADIALTATAGISKDLDLDLGGYDLSADGFRALWQKEGKLTVSGKGSISATGAIAASSSVIRVGDNEGSTAELVIGKDVTVTSDKCYGITYFGKEATKTVTIDGKVAVTGQSGALSGNGTAGLGGVTVNISDGAVITSEGELAIYKPEIGTMTIGKATLSGSSAIGIKCGSLILNGTTVNATGKELTPVTPYDNGATPDGSAILIENNDAYDTANSDLTSITINDAVISSQNAWCINEITKDGSARAIKAVNINSGKFKAAKEGLFNFKDAENINLVGGIFSSKPNFVPAWLRTVLNPDQSTKSVYPYTVEGVSWKTRIGDKTFDTYDEAFAAAKTGDVITVEAKKEPITKIEITDNIAPGVTVEASEGAVVEKVVLASSEIKDLTIKNFKPSLKAIDGSDFSNGFLHLSKDTKVENLVVDGCTFTGPNSKNRTAIFIEPDANAQPKTIEIKNCTCTGMRYFVYSSGQIPGTTIKISDCTATNMFSWAVLINNGNVAGLDIQNCTFSGGDIAKTVGTTNPDFKFTFKNNTITGDTANFTLKAKPENTDISGNTKNGVEWNPTIGEL